MPRDNMQNQSDDIIMIVEDSPEDYEAYMSALTLQGNIVNPVVWFETGEEAINYLHRTGEYQGAQHKMPAIVFLDLNLPGMDGRDFLSKLKTSEKTKHLPVVVMTSSDARQDIDHCYQAGANSYVVKPVALDGFMASIRRLREYWFKVVTLPVVK